MLVVNPCAGRKIPNLDVAYIVLTLQKHGHTIKVFYTKKQGDATNFVKEHGSDYDTIVCCGGDGTFHEVINGVLTLDKSVSVGYIPTGTTNDFAKNIGISGEIKEAVQTILRGEVSHYDIGEFNNEYFTYVASFGAFSDVPYLTPQRNKNLLGHFAYILEALKNLKVLNPVKVKATIDGRDIEDEFVFGAVVNSLSIGGILRFKQNAVKFDDGIFEVIFVKKPKNAQDIYRIVKNLRNGNYSNDNIVFAAAQNLKLDFEDKVNWNLDGEYVKTGLEVEIKNLKKRLEIIK